jgi:hypothetical protein
VMGKFVWPASLALAEMLIDGSLDQTIALPNARTPADTPSAATGTFLENGAGAGLVALVAAGAAQPVSPREGYAAAALLGGASARVGLSLDQGAPCGEQRTIDTGAPGGTELSLDWAALSLARRVCHSTGEADPPPPVVGRRLWGRVVATEMTERGCGLLRFNRDANISSVSSPCGNTKGGAPRAWEEWPSCRCEHKYGGCEDRNGGAPLPWKEWPTCHARAQQAEDTYEVCRLDVLTEADGLARIYFGSAARGEGADGVIREGGTHRSGGGKGDSGLARIYLGDGAGGASEGGVCIIGPGSHSTGGGGVAGARCWEGTPKRGHPQLAAQRLLAGNSLAPGSSSADENSLHDGNYPADGNSLPNRDWPARQG